MLVHFSGAASNFSGKIDPAPPPKNGPYACDARKILQQFLVSTSYRPITHIKALIVVTVAGCCKKTLVIFVFADLTPDGFHFWITLSPRTSEPVRHASVPAPLEQNSGDATVQVVLNFRVTSTATQCIQLVTFFLA